MPPSNTPAPPDPELETLRRQLAESEKKAADARTALAATEQNLARLQADRAVERVAAEMGFKYPSAAPRLVDPDRVTVDPATGKASGVREALERLLKDMPNLAWAESGGGTPNRNNPRPTPFHGREVSRVQHDQPQDLQALAKEALLKTGKYNLL